MCLDQLNWVENDNLKQIYSIVALMEIVTQTCMHSFLNVSLSMHTECTSLDVAEEIKKKLFIVQACVEVDWR